MEGMNAVPDPDDPEERKGCSGRISKLIISENENNKSVAMAGGSLRTLCRPTLNRDCASVSPEAEEEEGLYQTR